tara:strand:+ start:70 stop:420 length:351 start_codon:yes stop_codon:yes gene_type:complete
MKIRQIVKDAFKVDELVYQFREIDVPDGYLKTGTIENVNETYNDIWIMHEAYNKLDIAMDECNQEEPEWREDAAQLRRFIKKWRDKTEKKNSVKFIDGIARKAKPKADLYTFSFDD